MYRILRNGPNDIWFGKGWTMCQGIVYRCPQSVKHIIELASHFHSVDKCTPIERKAVWLAYGPQLRAIGVIK